MLYDVGLYEQRAVGCCVMCAQYCFMSYIYAVELITLCGCVVYTVCCLLYECMLAMLLCDVCAVCCGIYCYML
jgi:hypothetical protein